jgi:hypothetical protein
MSISSGTGEEVFKGDVPPIALEILPYDKDKLAAVYAALVKEAEEAFRQPVKEWHGFDFPDVPPTVRSLLWSYGPDAVPFQVDFLYSPETGFRYWTPATIHAYSNIVEFATPEQVLKLAAITEDKGFIADTRSNAHYCRGLTWALEQLHEHGSDQIKALTEDVVKKYPNTLDPTNFGIGDQKFIQP